MAEPSRSWWRLLPLIVAVVAIVAACIVSRYVYEHTGCVYARGIWLCTSPNPKVSDR